MLDAAGRRRKRRASQKAHADGDRHFDRRTDTDRNSNRDQYGDCHCDRDSNFDANLGQNIGAPSTNLLGAANASLTVQNLVNLATGTAPSSTLPAGATAPTAEINTLADVLATCVQADDTASTPCQQLNCVATPGGIWSGSSCNITAVPETTIDAMLLIARNPANNVGALFALATSTNYSPVLGSAPNDWTLGLKFVGGGLNSNFGLAVDGGGDVWVVNFGNRQLEQIQSIRRRALDFRGLHRRRSQ